MLKKCEILFVLITFIILTFNFYAFSEELKKESKEMQIPQEFIKLDSNKENSFPNNKKEPSTPEWDGVYVLFSDTGQYKELIPLSRVEYTPAVDLGNKPYYHLKFSFREINFINLDKIQGFYFKGNRVIDYINIEELIAKPERYGIFWRIVKPETANIVGYQFYIRKDSPNLFLSLFRCKSSSDSQYCEFVDKQTVDRRFVPINPENDGKCMLMTAGTHAKDKYRRFAICFSKPKDNNNPKTENKN